jgi:hypothetical protein
MSPKKKPQLLMKQLNLVLVIKKPSDVLITDVLLSW